MLCVYKMQELLKLKITCYLTLEMLLIFFGTCYVMIMGHVRTLQSSQTSRKQSLMLYYTLRVYYRCYLYITIRYCIYITRHLYIGLDNS